MTNNEPEKKKQHADDHGDHGHSHSDTAHGHDDGHGHGHGHGGNDAGQIIPENSPQDWMLRIMASLAAIGFVVFACFMADGWDFWYLHPPGGRVAEPPAHETAAPATAPGSATDAH